MAIKLARLVDLRIASVDESTEEAFEAEHWPSTVLDRPVVLLDQNVQISRLPHRDGLAAFGHQTAHGSRVVTALVDLDCRGHVVRIDRAPEESLRRNHVTVGGE